MVLLTAGPAYGDSLNFASLHSILERRNLGTVEELIGALPYEQRSRYALVFDSRSLQEASFENPRVILFGPDARFIVTFNGSPAQRGFRTVETMEFDAATREFHLHELQFPAQPAGTGVVVASEADPPRCARCHGTPPRPVWDTFPLWPGAYGERYGASLSRREREGLSLFLAQRALHPRYRYLLHASRFADPRTFRPTAVDQYSGIAPEPPNAELSGLLDRLQFEAIAWKLIRQPAFAAYQYALLGVADNACRPLADFYPEGRWRSERTAFERFARNTNQVNALQARLKAARIAVRSTASAAPLQAMLNTLLALRFVAESALRISTQDWTLALETDTYDFTTPPSAARPLRDTLLAAVAARDSAVGALSAFTTSSDGDRYCSYLKRRSRALLSQATTVQTADVTLAPPANVPGMRPGARPAALQLCVNCHETGVGPPIPFSDPAQLTRQLRLPMAPHGTLIDAIRYRLSAAAGARRMPLGLNLPDGDRQALEAYFATLAGSAN
ncbi:MAG: hypothetical protein ACRETG_03195 [Steroidobacteraceae bacterium]